MALLLQRESATLKAGLPPLVQKSLSELVRTMNCYYSNLIEGHNTHPVDIERALREDYSQDDEKRNLQLEAVAHVEVQKWLDEQPLSRSELFSTSLAREVHRRFMKLLPESLLWTENPDTGCSGLILVDTFPSTSDSEQRRRKMTTENKTKRTFSEGFKRDSLVTEQGYSVREAAEHMNVPDNYIRRWRQKYAPDGNSLTEDERTELKRLKKENKRLRMEQEILKKAAAFFASQNL
jgi:transposase-like protein